MLTPYQFASNSPIANIDLDGLEAYVAIYENFANGDTRLRLTFDETATPIEGGFYIIHNYYDETGFLEGGSRGTASHSSYPNFFPNSENLTQTRSDGEPLFSLNLDTYISYGGIRTTTSFLGAELGYELGGDQILFGYSGSVYNTADGINILNSDNFKLYDRERPYSVDVGAGLAFGAKYSQEFVNNEGYTGNESIELSKGYVKQIINNKGESTYKIEGGEHVQYLFGVKIEVSASYSPPTRKKMSLYEESQVESQSNSVQRDNTFVDIPVIEKK